MKENEISTKIIGCAIEVHRSLGPGLLESVYQKCLARELDIQKVPYQEEVPLHVEYKGLTFEAAYRMVANKVIIELKTVENIFPIHEAQLLSYLRLSRLKLGLLINFNVPALRSGVRRIVNEL